MGQSREAKQQSIREFCRLLAEAPRHRHSVVGYESAHGRPSFDQFSNRRQAFEGESFAQFPDTGAPQTARAVYRKPVQALTRNIAALEG